MRNLLSANLHRLKKSRAFWGCEIVSALYALFLGFELYLDMKKTGTPIPQTQDYVNILCSPAFSWQCSAVCILEAN